MTDSQIADINNRLDTLTQRVNNIELLTGTIGTSHSAIAQIYTRLDRFADTTNNNFAQVTHRFERIENQLGLIEGRLERVENTQASHTEVLANHTILLTEILSILRDRNGGSRL